MRRLLTLTIMLLSTGLYAQNGLEGLWEGVITEGDLQSRSGYRFELYLKVEEGVIKGVSTIFVSQDSIIKQELRGRMYQDRSVGLHEVDSGQYRQEAEQTGLPVHTFFRKYQFEFKRSIWDSTIEGYWQEVYPAPLDLKRRRGRIFLKRKESGA